MSDHRSIDELTQAAFSERKGCLPGFLLPPLVAALLSVGLMLLALGLIQPAGAVSITENEEQSNQAAFQSGGLSLVFTAEVQHWAGRIRIWAEAAGIDPNLAATVMQIESCGDPQATSRAGAIGLFQVMPYHFASGEDSYAPDTNALRGMDYLRRSLAAAGNDPRLALAGYNGGIGVIGWAESAWPQQTQNYAYWGSGIYQDAIGGALESPRLQEWLAANGLWLCRQAHERLGLN
jgi:hypothetical protein